MVWFQLLTAARHDVFGPRRALPVLLGCGLLLSGQAQAQAPLYEANAPSRGRVALQIGDCAAAITALPRPADDATRLALARCHVQTGTADQASDLLDEISDPGLQGYARLVRGEALVATERFAEATEVTDGLRLPGPAGERARLLLGRCQVEDGAWEEARGTLNGLLSADLAKAGHQPGPGGADPGELRWWLAQGAIRRGEAQRAVPVLQRLWTDNPSSPWAEPAAAWLAEVGQPVSQVDSPEGRALVKRRMATLRSARDFSQALILQDSLGESVAPDIEASLAFSAKDYARASAAFAQLASPTPAQRFRHALAMSRTGDYDAAADLYGALIQASPTSKQADQASYKLGYLAYDRGDLDRALALFDAHLHRYPASAYQADARWFRAWSLVRLGRLELAASALDDFSRLHARSDLAPNAAYWRAWIRHQTGDVDGARAAWQALVDRWPTSGAAWFASKGLGQHIAGIPTTTARPQLPAGLQTAAWRRGVALASVGLDQWARAELASVQAAAKAAGRAGRIPLALDLVDAGDYVTARALAAPWCGTVPDAPGDPWALRACTPRPYAESVSQRAATADLDPLLPYAIMNAESALKPWVTSLAGARGLMQLMPSLAQTQHKLVYGDAPFDPAMLYQPGYNSTLGTTELGQLRSRFAATGVDPVLPLVIAGYNGGADAVQRWLSAYEAPPAGARFAEDIGYTETRRYVSRVLGYLQQYRYVYGD